MRYLLISDIHSNLEALLAVLEASSKDGISETLCVGDIVGYGADPSECVKIVRKACGGNIVAGNHDLGVSGTFDTSYFNIAAIEAIKWTKKVLGEDEIKFLRSLEIVRRYGDAAIVHGSLVNPEEFNYILGTADAAETISAMDMSVCFVGHSHVPGIFYSKGKKASQIRGFDTAIERGLKYVVNIGSVGQPRDGDPRASYAIYDTDAASVYIKRVGYDIKKAQDKIRKAGLPGYLADRLAEGR